VSGAADSDRLRGAARISRCVNKGSACSAFPNSWPSADRPDPDLALDSADRRSDLCKTVLFGGEEADGHRLRPDSDANAARARYRAGDHGRAAAGGNRGARAAGGVSGGVGGAAGWHGKVIMRHLTRSCSYGFQSSGPGLETRRAHQSSQEFTAAPTSGSRSASPAPHARQAPWRSGEWIFGS
jgi:hypothetical protein